MSALSWDQFVADLTQLCEKPRENALAPELPSLERIVKTQTQLEKLAQLVDAALQRVEN